MKNNEPKRKKTFGGIEDKNPTLLNAIEKKLVFLVINKPSLSVEALGRELDLDPRTIKKLLDKQTIQMAIAEFQKNCDQILFDSLTKAAQVVKAALNSNNERIKVKTAVDLLQGLGKFRKYSDTTYVD